MATKLTKTQKELLTFLKTEGDPGSYTELLSSEHRTARALERKGLVKIQTWGEPGFEVLAAQVVTQEPAPKKVPAVRKPGSNWKTMNDRYWVSPSKYGQRYCCKHCGKRALGIEFGNPVHNHWNTCPVRVEFEKKVAVKEQVLTHSQILVQEKDLVRRALGEDISVIDTWERIKSGEFSGTILESQMKQLKSLQGAHYCDGRAYKRVPICSCGSVAVRSEKYDAYYCPEGLVWMTAECGDPICEFCRDRPERPQKP